MGQIGEIKIMNCGQPATIIRYKNNRDIDVCFEDGTIVKNRTYEAFTKGEIRNFNMNKNKYLGLSKISNSGFKMTIINYRNANDMDIQFEDGSIAKHKPLASFKTGQIAHPKKADNRIGEKVKATNGQEMEIIVYRKASDIDVRFEDGTIVKNTKYHSFKNGEIENPNFYNFRIGETKIANCGEPMKIIAYRSSSDIDIEFEGGIIVGHKNYRWFKKGEIGHPYIQSRGKQLPTLAINNITGKKVFDKYYHCQCSKCNLNTIMTFIEAKNHKC